MCISNSLNKSIDNEIDKKGIRGLQLATRQKKKKNQPARQREARS